MSFASGVKAELCTAAIREKSSAVAECYGVMLYCNTFTPRELRIITGSGELAARLPRLFRRAFGLTFDLRYHDTDITSSHKVYGTPAGLKIFDQRVVFAVSKSF